MKSSKALLQGMMAVGRNKRLLFFLLVVNILIALIPTLIVRDELADSMRKSTVTQEMAEGYSDLWFREFSAESEGLAETFHPTVSGIGAILNGLDAFFTGEFPRFQKSILGLGILYLLFWVFAAGGVISLFVRENHFSFRQFGTSGVFSSSTGWSPPCRYSSSSFMD